MRIEALGLVPDLHAERICAHFGGFGQARLHLPPRLRCLFLCYTNRSGSNFLAELLTAGGGFNRAAEYFTWDAVSATTEAVPMRSFEEYVSRIIGWDARAGWFAAKAAVDQLELLARIGFFRALDTPPAFLVITRDDRLGQAISFAIARQTGLWTSAMAGSGAEATPEYSRAAIEECLATIEEKGALLERFLTANAIVPLRIRYEALVASPQTELDRIAAWLSLPSLVARPEQISIRRQATTLNEAWRRRYLDGD